MNAAYTIHDGQLHHPSQPISFIPSPNFNARPEQDAIHLIVIHNISLPPGEFCQYNASGEHPVVAFFQNRLDPNAHPYFATIYQQQVSAHLFIERDGKVIQFVNFNDRAWHAGRSSYLGKPECNDYSIGIELEGDDYTEFTNAQYQALSQIIAAIYSAYPKTKHHLAGHSDIARGRKSDPGIEFDWVKLRRMIAPQ